MKPGMLNQDEILFLKVFNGHKAAYRRDAYQYEANRPGIAPMPQYEATEAALLAKGILKRDKAGRVSSKYNYADLSMLIRLQSDTVADLEASIATYQAGIVEQRAKVADLRAQNLRWPESMHLDNEIQQLAYQSEMVANLQKRLKIVQAA